MIGGRDWQLLSVLSRELHFGRAAEALGMRQPQLSLRLAQIERQVGAILFVRRPRVALTPAGEAVCEAGRRAFGEFQAAVERARLLQQGEAGSVVAGIASTAMLSDLPLSLARFRKAWPDISLSLRDMHSAQQWQALTSGLLDVAITREVGDDRTIRAEILGRQKFVALVPGDHPLAGRKEIALAALAGEPFVMFDPAVAPGLFHQINALCIRAGFTPRVAQRADEWYTVMGFVRAGFGVTIALDVFGSMAMSGVTSCAIREADANSPLFLCWDEQRELPARDALIDWLRADGGLIGGEG